MTKVTYLLGAGASCQALPMAKDFAERVLKFRTEVLPSGVAKVYSAPGKAYPKEYLLPPSGDFGRSLLESLGWLAKEAQRHASVDTYAKKLFIKNDEEAQELLNKLKSTLSCYLLLEQSLKPVDKRYGKFFAKILTRKPDGIPLLPEGVNIVTWNFDTQPEKSYKEFCEHPSYVDEGITRGAHNIIRLNGICGQPYKTDTKDLCYLEFSKSFFESVLNLFKNHMDPNVLGYRPQILFAWERGDLLTKDVERIKGTTTLVVIGYSFPDFNEDIDKVLFEVMVPTLEKVFIQVPGSEHSVVQKNLLKLFKNESDKKAIKDKIEMLARTDLFYIPDDMPR